MWDIIKCFFRDISCENGEASLTRIMSVGAFIAFLIGSFYLMFTGKSWPHYETFATMTMGAGAGTQVFNKFINSKYNSEPGRFPVKASMDEQTVYTTVTPKDEKSAKV